MTWIYWVIMIIQFIIIISLATKEPQVIEKIKDVSEEERLKLEHEKTKRLADLEKELSERRLSFQKEISDKRAEELEEINKLKERKYNELELTITTWEESQKLRQKEFLNKQEELKSMYAEELQSSLQEQKEEFDDKAAQAKEETKLIEQGLLEWKTKYDSAVEVYKKLEELKNADSHYRISFSPDENEELDELNRVVRKLKNPTPFYKAIYEIYYKNKVKQLTLRVVGVDKIAGIYKITHTESGKCYVGQSVDIANRWKQHIKRAVGADTRTTNMLYPAMAELGIGSFNFEIVK